MADDVFNEGNPPDEAPAEELSTNDLLKQLIAAQQELRADNNKLRQEISKNRAPSNNGPAILKTDEQLREERFADIRDASHYCPSCGNLSTYAKECRGISAAAGHPPVEMISTEELLAGDETQHTPAPVHA